MLWAVFRSWASQFKKEGCLVGNAPVTSRCMPFLASRFIFSAVFKSDNWLFERTLSIGYFALVDYSKVTVKLGFFTDDYQWADVNDIPELLFDQNEVVEKALVTLRLQTKSLISA
jgi:hypothetical protein